jgi:hypothetical protein
MKNALAKIVIGLAVVGAIVATASQSRAADSIYTGTNCVQENTTTPSIKYSYLGAFNLASSSAYWVCGIVRSGSSTAITSWDVTVNRRASNLAWDLQIENLDSTGNNGYGSTVTVPTPDGYQTLTGSHANSYFTNGKMQVISNVPPGAQITRIHVVQQ